MSEFGHQRPSDIEPLNSKPQSRFLRPPHTPAVLGYRNPADRLDDQPLCFVPQLQLLFRIGFDTSCLDLLVGHVAMA